METRLSLGGIELAVSAKQLEERKARWQVRDKFEEPDRVPVMLGIGTRYWLPGFGLTFQEYFSSPQTMLGAQAKAVEWTFANARDDRFGIAVGPDFQNVREASGLGCVVKYVEGFPWVEKPIIADDGDLGRLEVTDMYSNGLTGKIPEYYHEMVKLTQGINVSLKGGGSVPLTVSSGMGTDGPFTNCAWLRGSTQLLADVILKPEFVHAMMDIVTDKIIEFNHRLREDAGIPEDCGMGVADDFAAFLSPDQYREFALPYHERIYDAFKTKLRDIHLCGKIDHLLTLLLNEQHIHSLNGFGWVTDALKMAKTMGGKVLLYGGPSPSLILSGPKSEIIKAAKFYLQLLGPYRGYALGDGYNIAPGTPVEHMNALMDAATKYGRYPMNMVSSGG